MPVIFSWVIHFLSMAISPDMPNGLKVILQAFEDECAYLCPNMGNNDSYH